MGMVPRASFLLLGFLVGFFATVTEWRSLGGVDAWEDSGWGNARQKYPGAAKPKPKPSMSMKTKPEADGGNWKSEAELQIQGEIADEGWTQRPRKPVIKLKPKPWPYPIWDTPAWHLHAPGHITPYMPGEEKKMAGGGGNSGSGVSGRFLNLFPSRTFGWNNVSGKTTTHEEGGKTWFDGQNYTLETLIISETTQQEEGEEIKQTIFGGFGGFKGFGGGFGGFGKRRKKRGVPVGVRLPLKK
ncbi:unnamed protein product [Orchesella dallaii]|uniref:Secreted protein n=1 Tax=Orchesella dallaii TaxID=48710 RepID=A0ABP1RW60_9HEXA